MVFGGVGGEEPQSQIGLECFFRGPVPHVLHPRSLHLLNILGSIRDHIFDRSFGNRQAIRLGRNNKSFTNNRISISNHHVASSSRKLEKDISLDKIRFQPTSDEIGPVFPPIIYYKAKKICVFTIKCQKNLGSVGRHFFIFYYRQNRKQSFPVPIFHFQNFR